MGGHEFSMKKACITEMRAKSKQSVRVTIRPDYLTMTIRRVAWKALALSV